MRYRSFFLLCCCFLLISLPPAALAAAPAAPRYAIVLASFGTTDSEGQKIQQTFYDAAQKRYPGIPVYMGLTARMVQAKLKQQGVEAASLFRVLADAADGGYTHVAVQSLQVVPGEEYEGVVRIARAQEGLPKGIRRIAVGGPLLATDDDVQAAAAALVASLPAQRAAQDAVIFVGHGSPNGVGAMAYSSLQWHLSQKDPRVFIGTIDGAFAMEKVLQQPGVAESGVVWLAPMLALAGEHARNDIYGADAGSWQSRVKKTGKTPRPLPVALFAIPQLRDIWFAHLDAALAELGYTPPPVAPTTRK